MAEKTRNVNDKMKSDLAKITQTSNQDHFPTQLFTFVFYFYALLISIC